MRALLTSLINQAVEGRQGSPNTPQHSHVRDFIRGHCCLLLSTSACFLQGARRVQMPSRWMCTGARGGGCNGARDTT